MTKYRLLSGIKSPADLKCLPETELESLCEEIRQYLIECLSVNPGHFASSMGAVEIIVALHYVFDTPDDHIVFDVGHQAYTHKLLTGRFEEFETQRRKGGISGFPFPAESEYDSFVCGHAGNSISAALGLAIADRNTPGRENRKTVALIGDASIGNGLAFEGLNNVAQSPNNMLIVLNDNDMSIDDNVGALHRYLSDLSTSKGYNRVRYNLYKMLRRHGIIQEKSKGLVLRFNNALKSLVARQQNIFEGLNIRYFGPFNGNDVLKMVKVLRDIKDMEGPRILHIHTKKGKGFTAAELEPQLWHAPGKFDPESGRRASDLNVSQVKTPPLWQDVFGESLLELAEKDDDVIGITAAMPSGTSVGKLSQMPNRMFDVGISEGHAVTFAGGMAAGGKKPYVAIYSAFLQRAFDNIIHDVAIQGLPVRFCIDRAGIVGEDGVTHHGMLDIAYLRIIPGLKIASPMDARTLRDIMHASLEWNFPVAIRYPRGRSDSSDFKQPLREILPGRGRALKVSSDAKIAILSFGPVGLDVQQAISQLEEMGINADHYDMIWAKPLDSQLLSEIANKYDAVITVEDGVRSGGFGSAVSEWFDANSPTVSVRRLGIPDKWILHGSPAELKAECGYDTAGIVSAVKEINDEISSTQR
ncbi:MAG: 1-deoxy-D-xylulose-5-phosphate synthase [Muribaculaceae bacterium]|nr:1-deoxy-D-xylulose-5-phosphate synthase [Muribaculaceae bacterium]